MSHGCKGASGAGIELSAAWDAPYARYAARSGAALTAMRLGIKECTNMININLTSKRERYAAAMAAPQHRKANSAYMAPPLMTTIKHIVRSVKQFGVNKGTLSAVCGLIAPYMMPYTPVMQPAYARRRREQARPGGTVFFAACIAAVLLSALGYAFSQQKTTAADQQKRPRQYSDRRWPEKAKHTKEPKRPNHTVVEFNGKKWQLRDGPLSQDEAKAAALSICLQSDVNPDSCNAMR